jgi:hypothetical protein
VSDLDPAAARLRPAASRRSFWVVALTVTGLFLVAGCGGPASSSTSSHSPSPSPSPSPTLITAVQACSLVTADDASSATGKTLTNLGAGGSAVPGACFYASADGKTSVIVFAQVYPDSTAAQSVSAQQIAAALTGAGSGLVNAKVVTGIGDKAVEYTVNETGSNGIVIFVFKTNVLIMIVISPSPGSTVIEQLATTAVGRL